MCATRVQAVFRRGNAVMRLRDGDDQTSSLSTWLMWLHTKGLHNLPGAQRLAFKEASVRRRVESEASAAFECLAHPTAGITARIERSDPTLTVVNVSHHSLGPATLTQLLTALLHNEYVTELDLSHVAGVSDYVCAGALASLLKGNTRLRRVSLAHTPITDTGATALLPLRPKVVMDVAGTLLTKTMRERFSAVSVLPPMNVVPKVKCTLLPPLSM